jgi:hypothetical protein
MRYTGTKFDQQKVKAADANTFSAQISSTGNTIKAHVTFKDGRAQKEMVYTFLTESQMQDNLKRLDPSVKFLNANVTADAQATERTSQDDSLLENMRTDPAVKDVAYFTACRTLKQQPKPRPDFTGTKSAQKITGLPSQMEQLRQFGQAHPELNYGVFGDFNYGLIAQWMANENREYTTPNLEQAYLELNAAHCFKSFDTGRPGGRIVQTYDHAALVVARKSRAAVIAPPAGLTRVDLQAWNRIHQLNPHLDVRSDKFRSLCQQQVYSWAKINAIKEGLTEANAGELSKRCDEIILGWARQSNINLGTGNKSAVDRRIWLG